MVLPSLEFRKNAHKIQEVAKWFDLPITREIIDMLQNERPSRMGRLAAQVGDTDCVRALGVNEGWEGAIDFILTLGIPLVEPQQLEETFGDGEQFTKE